MLGVHMRVLSEPIAVTVAPPTHKKGIAMKLNAPANSDSLIDGLIKMIGRNAAGSAERFIFTLHIIGGTRPDENRFANAALEEAAGKMKTAMDLMTEAFEIAGEQLHDSRS